MNEYDGSAKGNERAGHGGARNFKVANPDLETTLEDMGLTKQELSDFRNLQNAEEENPGIIREDSLSNTASDKLDFMGLEI